MSTETQTPYEPADHTVEEVVEYLATASPEEVQRVQEAEAAGKDRAGIRDYTPQEAQDGPQEPAGATEAPQGTQTKAATFTEAAEAATPTDEADGLIGVSPERERTGMDDKGLSQRNPAVLSGGPLPDARPGVDDAEALKA